MTKPNRGLLIWMSVLTGLGILTGGAALTDLIGKDVAGLAILAVSALTGGTQFYINGNLTPADRVMAYSQGGATLAGPAAPQPTGSPVAVRPSSE